MKEPCGLVCGGLGSLTHLAGFTEHVGVGHHPRPPIPMSDVLARALSSKVSYNLVGLCQYSSEQRSVPWQAEYLRPLEVSGPY